MTVHVYNGTSWVEASEVHVYNGASWVQAQEVYIYNGTSWLLAYTAEAIGADFPSNGGNVSDLAFGGGTATAVLTFLSNGQWQEDEQTLGVLLTFDWATNAPSTTGANFWWKWQQNTGSAPSSAPTENVYLQLSSSRQISYTRTGSTGITGGTIDITLATSSGGAGAVTKTFTMQAEVSA